MFKQGNYVREITDTGDGEVMIVTNVHDDEVTMTVQQGNNDYLDVRTDEYELVCDEPTTHEDNMPLVPNTPERSEVEIHDDIAKMFIQVANYMRQFTDDKITLQIVAETFSPTDELEVEFKAACRYEDNVVSDNLYRSAQVAVHRHTENKTLHTLKIPFQKKSEAA